jgi:hypothetical protein
MKQQKSKPTKASFKDLVLKELEQRQQQNLPCPSRNAVEQLWVVLGPKAHLSLDSQVPISFAKVRDGIVTSGMAEGAISQQLDLLRGVLRKLVHQGLRPECVEALSHFRRGTRKPEAPTLQQSELKIILCSLATQVETFCVLVWIALSGALQLVSAVFLEFANVDWSTGIITYQCPKTGRLVRFGVLPPLMDLLRRRKERMGPDAVYVFPELIFTESELETRKCNTVRWEQIPYAVRVRATLKANQVIANGLNLCGLQRPGLTYKCFRLHQISVWAAAGVRLKTTMWMCGHMDEPLHTLCEIPLEPEVLQIRDITWKYLQAVQQDLPCGIPATAYEIQESLRTHYAQLSAEIARLANSHQELVLLCRHLAASRSLPKAA